MAGLTAASLAIFLAIGPNHYLIDQQFAALSSREREWLVPQAWMKLTQPVWLVAHEFEGLPRAYATTGKGQGIGTRELPGLELRRLYLHRRFFGANAKLRPARELGVDEAAALFRAYLSLEWQAELPAWSEAAATLGPHIPEGQRATVLLDGALDFASHLLALINEVSRAESRGISFCDRPDLPLLVWWQRSFDRLDFPVVYLDGAGQEAEWPLPFEVRPGLARALLGQSWKGQPDELPLCR